MRYWIFDRDETPQGLPLRRLLAQVRLASGAAPATVHVTKARGYGTQIRAWELALDNEEEIMIPFDLLDVLSAGTDEWFYDFEAHFSGSDITFGIHDSTALFVDAEPRIAQRIASSFSAVEVA